MDDPLEAYPGLADDVRERLGAAARALDAAKAGGDPDAALRAAYELEELYGTHDLEVPLLRVMDEVRALERAARRRDLLARLAPRLAAADPAVRAEALWSLGLELHHSFADLPAAADAYREAVAAGGPPWVTVVAAMNLGQILQAEGDVDGALAAYDVVVRVGPTLEDHPVADARTHEVAAGWIAALARDRSAGHG